MATLAELKKKIAQLEAQVEQITTAERASAVAKVKQIMDEFGVTIEHLIETRAVPEAPSVTTAAVASATAAKQPEKVRRTKSPKYRDPVTGTTWAGVGRTPAWIANATNRDDFLVVKPEPPTSGNSRGASERTAGRSASKPKTAPQDASRKSRASKPAERRVRAQKAEAVSKVGAKNPAAPAPARPRPKRKPSAAAAPAR